MEIKMTKWPSEEDWLQVKRRALVTVGLVPKTYPNDEWKKKILKARHSPIRYLFFSFDLIGIPSYVATHLARHVHAQPHIQTQRNDRQNNYDRNAARQDAPVNMIWDVTGEELLIVMNKRLCRKADSKTREIIKIIREKVIEECPEFTEQMIPMCMYTGGCKELEPCGERKK